MNGKSIPLPAANPRVTGIVTLSLVCLLLLAAAFSSHGDSLAGDNGKVRVQAKAPLTVRAFELKDVRLLEGPFRHAMELDEKYLLELDADRLLRNFRVNAGLPSTAEPLGGWEAPDCELRGHFVGHYMSACALMFASTGDKRFKERGDAVVAGLAECQDRLGGGYLSAFPESFIDRVEKPSRVWAPYYTLHKIFAGLEDMYVYCDNQQALGMAKKFGDWAIARNSKLSDEQMQRMLNTEHGGMNETLANLYALTGEEKYLKISLRFNHHRVLDPAESQEDKLTGLHANTQIPKFIGNARQYELTADPALKTAALFFWNTVVKERSYVIGGHSDGEMFSAKERLSQALGPNTTETCNTYNMLKLTRHLICWDPKPEYADYYERALYNHILASQNPETGMMCYYVPLRSGSRRNFNGPNDSFWCCTGTGVENHAKYCDSIYFHDDQDLYVNLFIASEVNWAQKGITLRQETTYPAQGATSLKFTCKKPVGLTLRVRRPFWATEEFSLRVNGRPEKAAGSPGTYASVKRTWKTGDTVEISMPFHLRIEAFRDNSNRFAILNGPLVLCAQVDSSQPFPAVVSGDTQLLASLKPIADKANTFSGPPNIFMRASGQQGPGVTLAPFYKAYNEHYEVYWDRFTPAEWEVKREEYRKAMALQKELDARTVDSVNPGEEQTERDHNFKGEQTDTREFNGRTFRFANTNGWFAWEMKVLPGQPQELRVSYGGRGGGTLEVFVDDADLGAIQPSGAGREPVTNFPLSAELLKGKEKVTIKFQAPADRRGAAVYNLRILKPATEGRKPAEGTL